MTSFFLKKWAKSASFCLFSFFSNTNLREKNVVVRGIRTRIVRIEGERADHLTTTTALAWLVLAKYLISEWSSYAKFCIGSSMGKMLQSFGPI